MEAKLDKQQKFIVLRAEGNSFDSISKLIKVSKPTLIKWNKEYREKIEEIACELEDAFLTEQKIKRTLRAQIISNELDKAYEALEKTDYENMSKKDLIKTVEILSKKLEDFTGFKNKLSQAQIDRIVEENPSDGLIPSPFAHRLKDKDEDEEPDYDYKL